MAKREWPIALVDPHPCVREGLRAILAQWPNSTVVLEVGTGADYERTCAEGLRIDLVIVEPLLPRTDGFATIAWIKENKPEANVLVLTADASDDVVHHALLAGAHGALAKASGASELRLINSARFAIQRVPHWGNHPAPKRLAFGTLHRPA